MDWQRLKKQKVRIHYIGGGTETLEKLKFKEKPFPHFELDEFGVDTIIPLSSIKKLEIKPKRRQVKKK